MKALLTSAGFENYKISKVFLNQINKDPKDIKVVFIPTAADSADSIAMLPKCMNDLLNIGISKENVYVYDLHYKMKFSILSNYDGSCPEYVNIVVGFFDINYATLSRAGFNTSKSETRYFRASRLPHRSGCLRFASSITSFRRANIL